MPGISNRKMGQKVDLDFTLRKVFGKVSFRYEIYTAVHPFICIREHPSDSLQACPARSHHSRARRPRCFPPSRHQFRQKFVLPAACCRRLWHHHCHLTASCFDEQSDRFPTRRRHQRRHNQQHDSPLDQNGHLRRPQKWSSSHTSALCHS